MSKKVFDKIAAGLAEAAAIARGDKKPAEIYVPPEVDVRAIRRKLGLTQGEFAAHFGLPVGTIRDWEQHRRQPAGAARVLLQIIRKEPKAAARALRAEFADA